MGYTDLHTHGIAGYDARSADPDEYLEMAAAYEARGTGAFMPTLFPGPVDEMRAALAAVGAAMERRKRGAAGAEILGAHMEGPFLNPARAGALDAGFFLIPDTDTLARLVDGFDNVVRIMTVAPELPGALAVTERAASMGIRVNMGHSEATFAQASEGARAGASGVTHLFNAMPPMHHREPGLAGYALSDDRLYVEVIADMRHLHPDTVRLIIKCKPEDRVLLVSDSLREAGTTDTDGEPVYMPDGVTLAGSGITLRDAVKNLVSLGLPEEAAERFASGNPRAYLDDPV